MGGGGGCEAGLNGGGPLFNVVKLGIIVLGLLLLLYIMCNYERREKRKLSFLYSPHSERSLS